MKIGSALLASACLAVPTMAGAATFDLCAGPVNVTMSDTAATVVPMWGFAPGGATLGTCDNTPTVPGPELSTTDTGVTINLTNTLSATVSVVIPGQTQAMVPVFFIDGNGNSRVRSFTTETAANGGTQAYTWSNMKPGTFVYHSGTHSQVQVQMGLYGAVILDAAADEAYPGYRYDADAVLFFSEIDPALHDAVNDGDYGTTVTSTINYVPKYFLINGRGYDSAAPGLSTQIIGGPGSRTLLRFVNMGLRQHTAILQGSHVQVIAEDGNLYPFSREQYSVNLPAAKTKDALFFVPDGAAVADLFPVYDRALGLTNNTEWDGGMLAYLQVGAVGTMIDVPNVVNQTQATAEADIAAADLTVGATTFASDALIVSGNVISQNPTDCIGCALPGSSVDLVISTGLALSVPDVVGQTQASAELDITNAGLSFTTTTAYDGVVTAGNVISQNPTTCMDCAQPGDNVDLVVSLGQLSDVPNVVGQTQVSAETDISNAGLTSTTTTASHATVPVGSVISQDPSDCTACVPPGSSVDLVISTGPAANAPPVANDDFASISRKPKGSQNSITIDLLDNDTDADGSLVPGSTNILSTPSHGAITDHGDGTVTYEPTRKKGTFNLTYTVEDNVGATSNVATLRINVTN